MVSFHMVARDIRAIVRQIMRLGWKAVIPFTLVWLLGEGFMVYFPVGPWKGHILIERAVGNSSRLRALGAVAGLWVPGKAC